MQGLVWDCLREEEEVVVCSSAGTLCPEPCRGSGRHETPTSFQYPCRGVSGCKATDRDEKESRSPPLCVDVHRAFSVLCMCTDKTRTAKASSHALALKVGPM